MKCTGDWSLSRNNGESKALSISCDCPWAAALFIVQCPWSSYSQMLRRGWLVWFVLLGTNADGAENRRAAQGHFKEDVQEGSVRQGQIEIS